MKKIMFNDKYGLTQAVLDGRKTMTRRIATYEHIKEPSRGWLVEGNEWGKRILCEELHVVAESSYAKDEVIAIAQAYKDTPAAREAACKYKETKGWGNKMFVRADLMPHHIKITDIKVERLQELSDEDMLKEGIRFDPEKDRYVIGDISEFFQRDAFSKLIDKVSGKGTWDRNPWVFAYEFELES